MYTRLRKVLVNFKISQNRKEDFFQSSIFLLNLVLLGLYLFPHHEHTSH